MVNTAGLSEWSYSYEQARERFVKIAESKGVLSHLPIASSSVSEADLYIDIVWIGRKDAKNVLLVQSGIHGVEAYAGSAIQISFLQQFVQEQSEIAVVLVHVLNPYGMKTCRRVNENNVDLNRNSVFLKTPVDTHGDLYNIALNKVLNPMSKRRDKWFWLKMILVLIENGYSNLAQSIAQGQYCFPKGVFYGGESLQTELVVYKKWLVDNLRWVRNLFVLDLHTGLGRYAKQSLIGELSTHKFVDLESEFVCADKFKVVIGNQFVYQSLGSISGLFACCLPNATIGFVTVEQGTYPAPVLLRQLCEENRIYFQHQVSDQTRAKFLGYFSPDSENWRARIVANGLCSINSGLNILRNASIRD